MAFKAHWQRVLDHIERAKLEGATLLCGGEARTDLGDGYFVAPTVFQVDNNQLSLCQEEVFGPVVSIQVFDDDGEALSIANDSRFGLVGYCWTRVWPERKPFNNRLTLEHYGSTHRSRGTYVLPSVVSKSQALAATGPVKPLTSSPRKRPPSLPWVTRPFAN